jgi:hypothetical protein
MRSGVGFGGVDLQILFIPSWPGSTGLIGAFEQSDQCVCPLWGLPRVSCLIRVSLGCAVVGQFFASLELCC